MRTRRVSRRGSCKRALHPRFTPAPRDGWLTFASSSSEQIFHEILNSSADIEYMVKVSYMEIYMEKIRDLLAR
jgi:hypothetical protein